MGTTVAAVAGMIGLALVVTAMTLPGRQTPNVINAAGSATSKVMLASLGQA
jgi:hypothetical protein